MTRLDSQRFKADQRIVFYQRAYTLVELGETGRRLLQGIRQVGQVLNLGVEIQVKL